MATRNASRKRSGTGRHVATSLAPVPASAAAHRSVGVRAARTRDSATAAERHPLGGFSFLGRPVPATVLGIRRRVVCDASYTQVTASARRRRKHRGGAAGGQATVGTPDAEPSSSAWPTRLFPASWIVSRSVASSLERRTSAIVGSIASCYRNACETRRRSLRAGGSRGDIAMNIGLLMLGAVLIGRALRARA